eukprot:364631-Chlamydomonas_euryale.AAC.5
MNFNAAAMRLRNPKRPSNRETHVSMSVRRGGADWHGDESSGHVIICGVARAVPLALRQSSASSRALYGKPRAWRTPPQWARGRGASEPASASAARRQQPRVRRSSCRRCYPCCPCSCMVHYIVACMARCMALACMASRAAPGATEAPRTRAQAGCLEAAPVRGSSPALQPAPKSWRTAPRNARRMLALPTALASPNNTVAAASAAPAEAIAGMPWAHLHLHPAASVFQQKWLRGTAATAATGLTRALASDLASAAAAGHT